jgi:excisionase family DNA binding protein
MEAPLPTLGGLEPLMSIEELSDYLNVPTRTLYDWRLAGKGPCAVHIGRQLRYFVSDVHEWLRQQREVEPDRTPERG